MPTLNLTNLAPGRTATIQRHTRETQTTVGSAISLTNSGYYTYSADWPYPGDFDCVLSGFVASAASPFPVRDGVAYPYSDWDSLDRLQRYDAVAVQPTADFKRLSEPIVIGDDYLASVGRHFVFNVNAVTNYVAADLSCRFGGKRNSQSWLVTGTVSTITGGLALSFDLPKSATASLSAGYYAWSVEVYTTAGGIEVTRVVGKCPVQLVEKQT